MSKLKRLLVVLPECVTPGADKKIVTVRRMPFEPFQEVSILKVPIDTAIVAVDVVAGSELAVSVVAQNSAGDQSAPVAINLVVKDPLPPSLGGSLVICGAVDCVVQYGDAELLGIEISRDDDDAEGKTE